MIKVSKIAISLPKENLEKIECVRKKLGLQRSAVINKAVCFWLKSLEEKEMIKKYEEGYQKKPEVIDEVIAMEKLSAEAFEEGEWK